MKGFPNQVADLKKIATGMRVLADLVNQGTDARDDGIYGPALVRAGVAGTGHTPKPVDDYLREQLRKRAGDQSFRTTARGLRELYRLLKFIDDSGHVVLITSTGHQAAGWAGQELTEGAIDFWRVVARNLEHTDLHGNTSHPYQVLLRLVARKPGIARAKCALALEAKDDSASELDRIVGLADMAEDEIRNAIGASRSNWDNAKKVLPKFAEQLGDVIKTGESYVLAAMPGDALPDQAEPRRGEPARRKAARRSRVVTPETIATARRVGEFDEVGVLPGMEIDPLVAREAARVRLARFDRHQHLVRTLAGRLHSAGGALHADPFDVLAIWEGRAVLVEVKTLDGSAEDERERVREALSQLLYYEAFATSLLVGSAAICKVACFEHPIDAAHQRWLNESGIATIRWTGDADQFAGDLLASSVLGGCLRELDSG